MESERRISTLKVHTSPTTLAFEAAHIRADLRAELTLSPTHPRPSVIGITMMRFDGDTVVERWSSADFLGLMMQIGAIPAPAPAGA